MKTTDVLDMSQKIMKGLTKKWVDERPLKNTNTDKQIPKHDKNMTSELRDPLAIKLRHHITRAIKSGVPYKQCDIEVTQLLSQQREQIINEERKSIYDSLKGQLCREDAIKVVNSLKESK